MVTIDELAAKVAALEKENGELKKKVDVLDTAGAQKASASGTAGNVYSTQDISDLIGGFIDDFNSKAAAKGGPVAYMISSVDMDLRVYLVREGGVYKLMNAEPNSNADALSSMKLSVKPVPRSAPGQTAQK
ncbi:MAG: bZIP transcription factor [Methanomassiliicoccaceae archaeon]|jgi:hypothetical protein|nr:bZIP transcription factor [Methanomassiliicoccaceae archaeon]